MPFFYQESYLLYSRSYSIEVWCIVWFKTKTGLKLVGAGKTYGHFRLQRQKLGGNTPSETYKKILIFSIVKRMTFIWWYMDRKGHVDWKTSPSGTRWESATWAPACFLQLIPENELRRSISIYHAQESRESLIFGENSYFPHAKPKWFRNTEVVFRISTKCLPGINFETSTQSVENICWSVLLTSDVISAEEL